MRDMPVFSETKINELQKEGSLSLLESLLIDFLRSAIYSYKEKQSFLKELEKYLGKSAFDVETAEEFYCSELRTAVERITDKSFAVDIKELIELRCRGQYSSTIFRKSYSSTSFRFHAFKVIQAMRGWLRFYFYGVSVGEMLLCKNDEIMDFGDLVALEINRKNKTVIETVREMILGDNNAVLSRNVINGIIRSDSMELKGLLKDLLLAAKGQEGLRQSILESIDGGDLETFRYFFGCCVENDLFRFSSAARAFYTWTGISIESVDIEYTRRMASVAYECLCDKEKRKEHYECDDPFRVYLSLWAAGVEEIRDVSKMIEELMESGKPHKQLLAWDFVERTDNSEYRHNMAVKYLETEDMRLLGIITDCLHISNDLRYYHRDTEGRYKKAAPVPVRLYPDSAEERRALFDRLAAVVVRIGHESRRYPAWLFPWSDMTVDNDHANVLDCMICLAAYDLDNGMIDRLYSLREYMNVYRRTNFYKYLLRADENPVHRRYILDGMRDKSFAVKQVCVNRLMECSATDEDTEQICSMLVTKSSDLRKLLMKYLSALDTDNKKKVVERLVAGGDAQVQAAAELVESDEKLEDMREFVRASTEGRNFSDQTKVLLEKIADQKAEECSDIGPENGYGLFDPEEIKKTIEEFSAVDVVGDMNGEEWLSVFPSSDELEQLFDRMDAVIEAHKDHEYKYGNFAGATITTLLGNELRMPLRYGPDNKPVAGGKLDDLPFAEEFRSALGDYARDRKKLYALKLLNLNTRYYITRDSYQEWFLPFLNTYDITYDEKLVRKYGSRFSGFGLVIDLAFDEANDDEMALFALRMYHGLCRILGEDNYARVSVNSGNSMYMTRGWKGGEHNLFCQLRSILSSTKKGDEVFPLYFRSEYALERKANLDFGNILDVRDFIRAIDMGLITKEHLCDWIVSSKARRVRSYISKLTTLHVGEGKEYAEIYPWFREWSRKVAHNLVVYESKRGQADTPISELVRCIGRIYGANHFVMLLKALGNEGFFRGYQWTANTKQSLLSVLLRRCYPSRTDSAEVLGGLLGETGIKEGRLIEAAMYSPQWSAFIEKLTGWKGLKKAVWFFHAHVSETFSSDKETEVALYSPITPEQFNDGMFDADWFRECMDELGEKRFAVLHKFAKYIASGGTTHRRSQLFADAAQGKLDIVQLEREIEEKRNQDRLRAYAVIPLEKGNVSQLVHRYEFISRYKKESKQFGAQRRESERKASDTAIANLAVTCGLFDVNRMLWRLEKEKDNEVAPFLEKKEVQGYEVCLFVDGLGDASVVCEKQGQKLKTLPKSLAKDEYVQMLKQKAAELKDQKARSRESLESAMVKRTSFGTGELMDLLTSRTIAPMAGKLVMTDGVHSGFPEIADDQVILRDFAGNITRPESDAELYIAHPYHLFSAGNWSDYMHFIYREQVIQPFRQVFREYYPLTDEERDENTVSRRYAGYQVQPTRTAALLKGRGWTVDYEEGWQKVDYSGDIVVHLYSYADWFTPAEIESPTLELISFCNRRTGDPIPLTEIDPVLFSEVMRDIDLVVSVAYVGGVDVETSHSTVEMRRSVAEELCSLLSLDNVRFTDKHAIINGKLSEYSVHLGSGMVHAMGKGAVVILPVHSQHRGHIFLPFADDDPKTAEIMSKIIMLSDDGKIKDPTILDQIT